MKKRFLKLMAAIVFLFAWLGYVVVKDYQEYSSKGAFILEYHSISNHTDWDKTMVVKPEVFEHHLQYLVSQGYTFQSVAQIGQRLALGEKVGQYIALSFDDGYIDNYTTAFPLLQKYNAKGTFNVINNRIGKKNYMTGEQIKEMWYAGMEIGSHTYSHNTLDKIDPKYLEWEVGVSKYGIERHIAKEMLLDTLAYPCGFYNDNVRAAMKQYGFKNGLTGKAGRNDVESYRKAPYQMYRVIVIDDGSHKHTFEGLLRKASIQSYLNYRGINIHLV